MSPTLAELGIGRLFDVVPDAVVVGDIATGTVVAWNPAAANMFGYTADEAFDMPLETLVPDHLKDTHRKGLARYAKGEGGHLTGSAQLVELPAVRKDGTEFWVELRLASVEAPLGERRHVIAVFRDVTGRRQAQTAAVEAVEQLQTANTALRDFVAIAAHDIRSPVSAVSMALDLLSRSWDRIDEQERAEILDGARRHTSFAIRLLEDLLDVSSLESGELHTSPQSCDLADLLAESVDISEATVDVPAGLVVLADPAHVRRVTANLVGNATKYAAPPVTVTAERSDGFVHMHVDDHGPGIDEELQHRMFDKFARGASTAAVKPGAGLGLAIVAGLVRVNGGDVRYTRLPHGGSRFTCTWPVPPTTPRPRVELPPG